MKPAHMSDGWPPWKFIFATGIECSYPVITGRDGRSQRIDELEKTFHYKFWKQDLALVREMIRTTHSAFTPGSRFKD